MKTIAKSDGIYVIFGTPIIESEDGETTDWIDAVETLAREEIEWFNDDVSPFDLHITGYGCIVNQVFNIKEKAEDVAGSLTRISEGSLVFSVIDLTGDHTDTNSKHVREIFYAISVSGSAPFLGKTNMFLTDEEFQKMLGFENSDITKIDNSDLYIFKTYATSMVAAEDAALEFLANAL